MSDFQTKFYLNFIKDDRWKYITSGLGNTLKITVFALIFAVIIGVLVAIIRYSYDKNHTNKAGNFIQSLLQFLLAVANGICHVYLTIIRGVPVVVQLMIIYFIIFASPDVSKIFCAVVAFSLNSGAYVAEIVRGGLNSVDKGQFEAGRSLGFGYIATMWYIILPQAFKNILPALGNYAFKGYFNFRLCCYSGLNKGWRYYKKSYLRRLYATYCSSFNLFNSCYNIDITFKTFGKEVAV